MSHWWHFWNWFALGTAAIPSRPTHSPLPAAPAAPPQPSEPAVLVRGRQWKDTAAAPTGVHADPSPPTGLDVFVARLSHKDATARAAAAEELGLLGPVASSTIDALLLAGCDIDPGVRKAAAAALERIDPGWPGGPGAALAVPTLLREMRRGLPDVTPAASALLTRIGPAAVPALGRALTGSEGDLFQVAAARTLKRIGPAAAGAVPALAVALSSEFTHVRQAAAEALAEVGPGAEPATPSLVAALADWHPLVRQAAALSLGRIGAGAAELAVPCLLSLFADRDRGVREAAVEAVVRTGPPAVEGLIEMAEARDQRRMREWLAYRVQVSEWCQRPFPEEFQREPLKALDNLSWFFRHASEDQARVELVHEAAVDALGQIGPAAAAAAGVLGETLTDPNPRVRAAAARALGRIGSPAGDVLPGLISRLADDAVTVRRAAAEALPAVAADWASRPRCGEAIAGLAGRLGLNGEPGEIAVEAFAVIGSAAVPVLAEALTSPDRVVREGAATALGRIGAPAREATSALQKALGDGHGWVARAAAEALRRIDPAG